MNVKEECEHCGQVRWCFVVDFYGSAGDFGGAHCYEWRWYCSRSCWENAREAAWYSRAADYGAVTVQETYQRAWEQKQRSR